MALGDHVHIARRFQRAIRIDADLGSAQSLEGFVCPRSSADVLLSMARHVAETGQGAFTWTGPYGSGKSSLAVALGALLSGDEKGMRQAAEAVGYEVAKPIWKALPPRSKGWRVVPVVGRRDDPVRVIGEAIEAAKFRVRKPRGGWTEEHLIQTLSKLAGANRTNRGGLILFIDEMGKFLEAAAQDGSDVYVFQQLAEAASRSDGRLLVIGVLHQAFEEYANRLSREGRDEWAKVQGRFIDLAVNAAGEEQVELIARAIETNGRPEGHAPLARTVAAVIREQRSGVSERLDAMLEECWPLHPVVAALLGPISRRRFGQNQRSIFGFLNSAEPEGFQDFLQRAGEDDLYGPERLWDYLRINLEPSILASPDGHRWALAAEAIERCEAMGGEALDLALLKSIALIDLFKERSGLVASAALLEACAHDHAQAEVETALERLKGRSLILYKKFAESFAIFAGSDFDMEDALAGALEEVREIDFGALKGLAGVQPILAKRHYHATGALRWFEVDIAPLERVVECAAAYAPKDGAVGQFLIAIPTQNESEAAARNLCREAAKAAKDWDVVVGLSRHSWTVTNLARELLALEKVRKERAELSGDPVARREVVARLADLQVRLDAEFDRAFVSAEWYRKGATPQHLAEHEINGLASELADARYKCAPRIQNELLNRIRPSSNAVAAQKALLRLMVMEEGKPRLGVEGYPAEGGLYDSLLAATGLHAKDGKAWRFAAPGAAGEDPCNLRPLWDEAARFLEGNQDRTVPLSELYDIWRRPPYGLKDGLMPVLAVAFILSRRDSLAFYRQGLFQARFDDLDVDYLAKDPADIQLRWMDLSEMSRRLLSGMADVVRELDGANALADLRPIDVARGLIAIHENLEPWTKRTMRLSANAVRIRELFKKASDPNKFLFDDLPAMVEGAFDPTTDEGLARTIRAVRDGLEEMVQAYPAMLARFAETMLAELQVPNTSPQALADLRARAENIKQLAGDFRLDAFVARLTQYRGTREDIEGIASLAANKPPRDWIDTDLDRASIELVELAQRFNRAEAFARVKGRKDKRHAMAVVVGMNGRPAPVLEEFDVTDADRAAVDQLMARFEEALAEGDCACRNVILAALAELSARYMREAPGDDEPEPPKRRSAT